MYNPKSKERYICAPVQENVSTWVPEGKNGHIRIEGTSVEKDTPLDPNGDGRTPLRVLTLEDEEVLENAMKLPKGSLSIYKEKDNKWVGKNRFKVELDNEPKYFDMGNPYQYIQVMILKANVDIIAPSYSERQDKLYSFYLDKVETVDEESTNKFTFKMKSMEILTDLIKSNAKMETALLVLYKSDRSVIGRDIERSTMQRMLYEFVDTNPKRFYEIMKDPDYEMKAYFYRAIDKGAIVRHHREYRLANSNKIIGNTISDVLDYLNEISNNAEKQAEWEAMRNYIKK